MCHRHNERVTAGCARQLLGKASVQPGWPCWELVANQPLLKTKQTPNPKRNPPQGTES